MQPLPVSPTTIRFGLFEVDLSAGELRKRGRRIPLQDQPFRVLILLLQRPGELVTREDFQRALWPGDTFVEFDEGLNKAIQKLRQALDDSSDNPRFIETLPRKGYRFIAPVDRAAVEANAAPAQPTPANSNAVSPSAVGLTKRRNSEVLAWALLGAVSVALVVLAAGVYFRYFRPAQPTPKTVPLTSYPGRQITPALSPDGKQVAFAWDGEKGDNLDIYVKLADAGEPLRLTTNPAPEYGPAWSPDGRFIAFSRELPDHTEILMVPALGGAERKLAEVAPQSEDTHLSWSPNGKYLALADKNAPQDPYGIFLLSVETGEKRKLTVPPTETRYAGDCCPRFSPDGNTLAFKRSLFFNSDEIYVLPVTSDGRPRSEPRRLTPSKQAIFSFDWTADGRRIVYPSDQVGIANLLAISASGGTPERLAVADANVTGIAISRNSSRLVYQRDVFDDNIWRIPGPNSSDKTRAPARFIASTQPDREPQFSPDGTKIVFTSTRSGNNEIWICDSEGRNSIQLTSFNGPDLGSPRWSPDNRWIAFDSNKDGNWDIYVISRDGGQPRRLTSGPSDKWRPSWSHDGRWVYFGSTKTGDGQIWKTPAQGGEAVRLTKIKGGGEAFESFDGKFVYYAYTEEPGVWKVPVTGGEETRVLDWGEDGVWALTNQGICFFDISKSTGAALKFYNFATGKATLLRQFSKETQVETGSTSLTVSPDGRWILYVQRDQSGSNLMLVENFR